jgi:prophage regulatory protein
LHHNRILREHEVLNRTGLSRSTRWRLIQRKEFPTPVNLSDHAIGWKESDIEAWIEARIRAGSTKAS